MTIPCLSTIYWSDIIEYKNGLSYLKNWKWLPHDVKHHHNWGVILADIITKVKFYYDTLSTLHLKSIKTLKLIQFGHHFPNECISLNENVWISINILLKFVSKGPVNKMPTLVPTMFITSYSVTYCIYIPGKFGFCFPYCAVCDECK